MDIDQFVLRVRDPARTKEDLMTMRKNALAKGKPEFAEIVELELDQRFPSWNTANKVSGCTPTIAVLNHRRKSSRAELRRIYGLSKCLERRSPVSYKIRVSGTKKHLRETKTFTSLAIRLIFSLEGAILLNQTETLES
jgi:hypothetical protein